MDMFSRLAKNPMLRSAFGARRALFGPKRPSWTLEMEIVSEFMRLQGPVLRRISATRQRQLATALLDRAPIMRETSRASEALEQLRAEWFSPREVTSDAVVLFLHGGGYILGSADTHQNLIAGLCKASGCRAFVPDYRLAPEHPFPAAIEDAVRAYRYLLERNPAQRIAIVGDSAGGGLTLATLMRLRDERLPMPSGAAVISPWCDLEGTGATLSAHYPYDYVIAPHLALCAQWYLAGESARHPLASPIHGDFTGLPKLLIQAGGAEALLDDALRLAERARAANVEVELDVCPDMVHVFHIFASFSPEARAALQRIADFVVTQTATTSESSFNNIASSKG